MRDNETEQPRLLGRLNPLRHSVETGRAYFAAAGVLATGAVGALAARRDKGDKNDDRDRDENHNRDKNKDRDRDGDEESKRERRDHRQDGRNDDAESRKQRADSDVDAEKKNNKNDGGNNNNNRNKDDEPKDNNNNNDDDGGGNDGGGGNNAGSAFFDSPLATKARRRANDFDNRDRDGEEDGINVDVDPERESIYQTGSISYGTGPDGIEIVTRNINYTAVPTPTPTPFPRLELPTREPPDPGDVATTPTPVPTAAPSQAPPVVDSGDSASVPPVTADTNGGNNVDFAS